MRRLLACLVGLPVAFGGVLAACSSDDTTLSPRACLPPPRVSEARVAVMPAVGGATFDAPIEIGLGPSGRLYVLEQGGVVKSVSPGGGDVATVLDISSKIVSGGELGLLGIAFDPKFSESGFVYLHFSERRTPSTPALPLQSVIARYTSTDGGATIDPASEKRILVVDDPFSNHNGGKIAFGPDGFLYISMGDGGSGGDPLGSGQDKNSLLGKILRIDPNGGDPYAIPPSNPFAAGGGRPEIYAYGLRNPWKFAFDTVTGELWAGDVGQGKYEEIDRIVLGGNYGWNVREGKHCFNATTCPTEGFIDPVVEYGRADGVSVTGGYVYRGSKLPALYGKYVYGDFGSGRIWAVDQTPEGAFVALLLAQTNFKISTFAQDADGEIYVADYATGKINQLLPGDETAPPEGPGVKLSETGCLDPKNPSRPPPGLIAYDVNSPLWSDGADKERWVSIVPGRKATVLPDGDLDLPPSSVAVKTFVIGGKRIETRLFVRYEDMSWAGYSYEWNDEQTDAILLPAGKVKPLPNGGSWYFPSRAECFACHTPAAGFTLGLEARQLDRDDGTGTNQLARFANVVDVPMRPGALAPLRSATSEGSAEERARGYLHANCSMCHREGAGAGAATFDLRIDKSFAETKTCDVAPQAGDLGVAGAKLVAPGDPSRSTLALRMRALDASRMPQLATRVVDEAGVSAIETWIRALPAACP
ncbi:MAG: PQQ-dependent sugar dehydrogenase [Labilithrix sp.]|nr:PQQ-dependent sugar dehydrogenase [Labilithrix sp.]